MLTQLISALDAFRQVRIARSDEEREAIYKFRYEVTALELHEERHPNLDHARKRQEEEADHASDATLFYLGSPDDIEGTVRIRCWKPSEIPPAIFDAYSMSLLPDIQRRPVADVTAVMARPNVRGTTAVLALMSAALVHIVGNHKVEALFGSCQTGLFPSWRRMGLRPYGGRPVPYYGGMLLPVVGITADVEHLRRCRSPLLPAAYYLKLRGELPTTDIRPLLAAATRSTNVSDRPDQVYEELSAAQGSAGFLEKLPDGLVRELAESGYIVDVPAGTPVVEVGIVEREMYLVLDGRLEATRDGKHLSMLLPGDLFGEVAFFQPSGRRSATVKAVDDARLLVIRRSFLNRLSKGQPALALSFYRALTTLLARRLATPPQDSTRRTVQMCGST